MKIYLFLIGIISIFMIFNQYEKYTNIKDSLNDFEANINTDLNNVKKKINKSKKIIITNKINNNPYAIFKKNAVGIKDELYNLKENVSYLKKNLDKAMKEEEKKMKEVNN